MTLQMCYKNTLFGKLFVTNWAGERWLWIWISSPFVDQTMSFQLRFSFKELPTVLTFNGFDERMHISLMTVEIHFGAEYFSTVGTRQGFLWYVSVSVYF